MKSYRLRSVIVLVLGLAALAGLPGGGEALAQKKGGGGTPPPPPAPGTIYFSNANGTGLYASMNGDGSGKVQSTGGVPTYQKHGGSRWFLQHQSVGIGPEQWFAVNEAGTAVQFTNDPNLRWNGYPASWSKDDSAFTICCIYDTSALSPDPAEWEWIGQLYRIPVVWTDGVPTAGLPTVVLELRRPIYDEWGDDLWNDYEVSLGRHDWSPAGDEVALTRWVWGAGWVLEVVRFTGTELESRQLATAAANPVWSPDGSRIAFNRLQRSGYQDIQDIRTIKPDGTDAAQLTSYIAGKGYNGTGQYLPTWSPDGALLAYAELVISSSKRTYNIRRIPAGGGSPLSLTSDGNSSLPQWR
jgi:hypothetical protein